MLRFLVFKDGKPATDWPIRNAYLSGSDHSAMRAEIVFDEHAVICTKRELGPASLSLQTPCGDCGELTLATCLLPERDEPYILTLELARHRVMMLYNKLEEWVMFDVLAEENSVAKRLERARRLFIEALCVATSDPAQADKLATECLGVAVDGSEELALYHAEILLNRRKSVAQLPKNPIGVGAALEQGNDRVRAALVANFDFLSLPTPWKTLAPAEGEYRWQLMDNWAEWASRSRMPLVAGPIVCFQPGYVPDWIYIWEHDYDQLRDLLYEHTERLVTRYRSVVSAWNVVSGLHVNNHFTFSFDQIIEITRMCTMLVKKVHPGARSLVEIRQPFGEYYATNQRSIPPHLYADLLNQSALSFDGFLLRLQMGQAQPGQYSRDLMQISALLDQFASYATNNNKIHLSVSVPSEPVTEVMIATSDSAQQVDANSGVWRKPWSQLVQSKWLEALFTIVLSKPYVESIVWSELADHPAMELPLGGLMSEDISPKSSFRKLVQFRRGLATRPGAGAPGAPGGPGVGATGVVESAPPARPAGGAG